MQTIPILLPYGYQQPTDNDVRRAKSFILRRESAAHAAMSLIDALLKDAAAKIAEICYRYGVQPKRFTLTSKYNEKMFDEVAEVLNTLEEDIIDVLLDYATRCTQSEEKRNHLIPWILLLGRDKRNLRQTLETRMRMFIGDMETMIAALRNAGIGLSDAIQRIKTNIHTVYTMPEVKAAITKSALFQAKNIRTKGVKHGNVGNSNSETVNILRMVRTTVEMSWMRYHNELYKEENAEGYYVLRGSNYPCDLCDSMVGFHEITDTDGSPPYHPNCCCYAIPIHKTK